MMACTGGNPAAPTVERSPSADEPPRQTIANISYLDVSTNLLVNGDFEDYADSNVPDGWTVDEIYGYRGMYTPADGWRGLGVQFVRNAQGQHLLSQAVAVEPHHLYTAQLVYRVDASDASHGGLYVVDADGAQLASDTTNHPTNGWRIASVTFDSAERTQVAVKIGYPSGMNGTVVYDGVRVFEAASASTFDYEYHASYRDAIGIPALPVDELVPQLADYVTGLLSETRAVRLAHRDSYAEQLPYYLDMFLSAPDGGREAWCQRTSLVLAELLAMYGVPTRQIHSRTVQHQFLEYFNGSKWIAFDPYYGIRYVLAGKRLDVASTIAAGMDQVSIEVPTQKRVFLLELGYLRPIWADGEFSYGLDM